MYPIQIRIGSEYGVEIDFAAAVLYALTGRDTEQCERITRLVVTPVYAVETDGGRNYAGKQITYAAGSPVTELSVELHCRSTAYGKDEDAKVSIAGIMSHSPEIAMVRIACYTLAAQIAAVANAAAKAAKD